MHRGLLAVCVGYRPGMWQPQSRLQNLAPSPSSKMAPAMRRKRYDRLPTDSDESDFADLERSTSLNIRVEKMGRTYSTPRPRENPALGLDVNEEAAPLSLWGKARDAYVNMMFKTAESASSTSVVPVAMKLDRSLTLGSGFSKKVEVLPAEPNLGFKLNKMEEEYLKYLKRTIDSRYA